MRVSAGVGRYQAGELDLLLTPAAGMTFANLVNGTRRGVLYFHGRGDSAIGALWPGDTNPAQGDIARSIVTGGYPICSVDAGGTLTWGNSTARTRAGTAKTYMQGLGALSGKVHVVGVSMGALTGLNWIAANPTLAASFIGVLPVIDLNYVKANNISGSASEINTAYGGSYVAATEQGTASPAYMASAAGGSKFAGIPMQLWRATDDPYTPDATYTQFAVDADTVTLKSLGANGHTNAAIAQIVWGDLVTFLAAHD